MVGVPGVSSTCAAGAASSLSGAGGTDATLPDLVLIDGGRGQLQQAIDALTELGVTGITLVGIAKGASRRAGHEEWVRPPPAQAQT